MKIKAIVAAGTFVWTGTAHAEPGWRVFEQDGSIGYQFDQTAAAPTLEALQAEITRVLAGPKRTGVVVGDEIHSEPVRHRHYGVLLEDVFRIGALGGKALALAKGSPVYRMDHRYRVTTSADEVLYDIRWRTWCGFAPVEGSALLVERCVNIRPQAIEVADYREDGSTTAWAPATRPYVQDDPSAADALPVQRARMTLRAVSKRSFELEQEVHGENTSARRWIDRIDRAKDGSGVIESRNLVIRPEGDGSTFSIEQKVNEAEISGLARSIHADMVSRMRGKPAPDGL